MKTLTPTEESFCQLVAEGQIPAVECCRRAYGIKKSASRADERRAERLLKRKDIRTRVETLREEFRARAETAGLVSRDEAMRKLSTMFRATEQPFVAIKLAERMAKMGGWDVDQGVTVRNGGVSDDYRPPPALKDLPDEEIARLARGEL